MKNINYYNKENSVYSSKRYPEIEYDYVHFFFKKRLSLLLRLIKNVINKKHIKIDILEIGCADGVVSQEIILKFSDHINLITAIDISPDMIKRAKLVNNQTQINFFERGKENIKQPLDLVVEVGVLNLTNRFEDYEFVKSNLKNDGYYICSLASIKSIRRRLKFDETDDGFKHLLSFKEYEFELNKYFVIKDSIAYGFFVPYLWKIPKIARILQPIIDVVASVILTELCHEKIYLLSLKK